MKVSVSPAFYVTIGFGEEESDLPDLFRDFYREGWGVSVHGLGFGVQNVSGTRRALTFFTHRADEVVEIWEDFLDWLVQEERNESVEPEESDEENTP